MVRMKNFSLVVSSLRGAAKGALPILAGAALLSSPILSETANAMSCAGCNNRCMNSCFNTCHGTCSRTCSGTNNRN